MSEGCPKCGASPPCPTLAGLQQTGCRIRELQNENERLRIDNRAYFDERQHLRDILRIPLPKGVGTTCAEFDAAYPLVESAVKIADQLNHFRAIADRFYSSREVWPDRCNDEAKLRAQAEADHYGVMVHVCVHGQRAFTAHPSRILELESQVKAWADAALVSLAGLTPTPEQGYLKDGGIEQFKADAARMRREMGKC